MKDSLYRNSVYLMASTFVMSALGFLFWIINTKLFTTEDIGIATTIISVMSLISSFSLLGMGTGLIRYLPSSKKKNHKINTAFTLVSIVTIIISTFFLMGLNVFSPPLLFIKENIILSFIFIAFMVFASISILIECVFIALRNTKFVLLKNTIFSVSKLILPFFFISLGAYGIFSSWMISMILGFLTVFIILVYKFDYQARIVFYDSIIKQIGKYSFGNYIAGFLRKMPLLVLPLIITKLINPETTAYYYMAMTIATLLFVIPEATSESLFAEGSHDPKKMKKNVKKSLKIIFSILIPSIIIILFSGRYILLVFGAEYSAQGFKFLELLSISGVFVSINYIFETKLKVERKIKTLMIISFVSAFLILSMSYFLLSLGLIGIGLAWTLGQSVTSMVYLIVSKTD